MTTGSSGKSLRAAQKATSTETALILRKHNLCSFASGTAEEASKRSSGPLDMVATPSGNLAESPGIRLGLSLPHTATPVKSGDAKGRIRQPGPRKSRHLHSCIAAVITVPFATVLKQQRWKRTSESWQDL